MPAEELLSGTEPSEQFNESSRQDPGSRLLVSAREECSRIERWESANIFNHSARKQGRPINKLDHCP